VRIIILTVIVMTFFAIGCSNGSVAPVSPDTNEPVVKAGETNHALWGFWQGVIDPAAQTVEFTPLRQTEMHLNALIFLEPPALVNVTLESLKFNGDIIEADIGLRHPFLGLDEFTGFDVCGIFITKGTTSGYSDSGVVMAGAGDTRLLNPDGYSRWWNPAEFPVNNGTMLSYKDGLLGTPDSIGDYNATVNGYKYFCDDLVDPDAPLTDVTLEKRGLFSAGQKNVRHYTIKYDLGLIFNYAVDASWKFPSGSKPWDVPGDFAPEANRPEAWRVKITEVENTLWNDGADNGGNLKLSIDVYDWFNAGLNEVRVESPTNFTLVESTTPSGGAAGYSTYAVDIIDATPAVDSIDLFISVECENTGYGGLLPGKPVTSYFTHTSAVGTEPPGNLEGGVITFGGTGTEYILGFAVDSQGGKYSGGYFFGQANLDPDGNDPHDCIGGMNMWINKVDADGKFQWGYTWPSLDGYHCYIWGIAVDGNDDIYVCGHFVGTIDFDPGDGVDDHTAGSGTGNLAAFLMKFHSDGSYVWGESWDGNDYVTAFDLVIYNDTYIYISGYFFGTADIDPSEGVDLHTATSGSGNISDGYLIKIDMDGNYVWGRTFGAEGTAYCFDVAVDGSGNPCASGTFENTVDLDPTDGVQHHTSNGWGDTYIVKFLADGDWDWSVSFGGDSWDQINGMVADSEGNIYANGGFASTSVDFDPDPVGDKTVYNQGQYDGFLSKFDKDGDFLWVDIFGESLHDNTWDVTLDSSGNIIMGGHFQGTMDFDPKGGGAMHISVGNSDAYVVKLTSDGDFIWGESWGSTGNENSQCVRVGMNGLIHAAGNFEGTVDFEPGSGVTERLSNGGYDVFIDMFLPGGGW